jgi:hypothetical protein
MSKAQRDKGVRGQSTFANMLADRDWVVDPITSGVKREDMIATDPAGNAWSVEVKNHIAIHASHRRQAVVQAQARKLPWLLASKIAGTSSWLIQRRGMLPCVWHEKRVLL